MDEHNTDITESNVYLRIPKHSSWAAASKSTVAFSKISLNQLLKALNKRIQTNVLLFKTHNSSDYVETSATRPTLHIIENKISIEKRWLQIRSKISTAERSRMS